jgi:hypothetical protein
LRAPRRARVRGSWRWPAGPTPKQRPARPRPP